MPREPKVDSKRLGPYVGLGAAVLFVITATVVVLTQTLAPVFGLEAGSPDPTVIGSMLIWAAIAIGLPVVDLLRRRNGHNGNGGDE